MPVRGTGLGASGQTHLTGAQLTNLPLSFSLVSVVFPGFSLCMSLPVLFTLPASAWRWGMSLKGYGSTLCHQALVPAPLRSASPASQGVGDVIAVPLCWPWPAVVQSCGSLCFDLLISSCHWPHTTNSSLCPLHPVTDCIVIPRITSPHPQSPCPGGELLSA